MLRNLLRRPMRTTLTLVGITIGVAAVVAMGAMGQGVVKNYGGILGTSNDLLVTQANAYDTILSLLDEEMADRIQAVPGVDRVESGFFTFVAAEDLSAFLVFGYEPGTVAAAHFRIVEGKPLTGPRQVVLGRRAAESLRKTLEQTVRIYGVPYRIVGIYETGQGLEESGGLFTLADAQTISQKPRKVSLFQVGLRRNVNVAQVMRRIEAISKELAVSKSSEYQGNQAWSGMIQGFAWAIAVIAIVIGGLGMMNAMVMSVLERTREIGTLRAIGWSRGRVVRMILGESLLLSLIGGVAGLGVGYLLMQLTTTLRGIGAFFIGVVSPEILTQGLATALCLGLVGGAYPAWTAANLQPVEALRYEGGGTLEHEAAKGHEGREARRSRRSSCTSRFVLFAKLRAFVIQTPLPLRNLWRRRTRTLIATASIGVGVATLVMLGCIVKGLIGEFNSLAGSSGVGNITIMQRDVADMSLSSLDERFIAQIRAMPGVKSVSALVLGFVNTPGFPFFVVMGLDLNSAAMDHFKLSEGRKVQRPDEIIIGKAAAKNYKLGLGDTLTLYSTRYKVVGIYETGIAWEEGGGVIGLAEAQRLLRRPRSVSYIFVNVRNPAEARTLIASLNSRFTEARAALSSEFAQGMRDVSQTKAITDAVGLLALLIGGIVVANTMIMSIHERTREIGTLRALGWRRRQIMGQIIGETLLLCLLAGILGSALGVAFIWLIVQIPGADALIKARFDLPTMVRAILLALVVGTLGGLYPAWRASNLSPVEALRYE